MKEILLIGGSYGIGRAIAEGCSAEGDHVTVASRSMEEPINGVDHITFDASAEELSFDHLPEEIDGLVYCPGSINLRPFNNLKEKDFRKDMEVNFFQMARVVQGLLPRLKAKNGSLILFSTVAVSTGLPFHTSVSAAKGAIEGFARALAAECAPNVRVNVIAPSLTDTPLAKRLLSNDKQREASAERHPLKRVGTTADISNAARFLLSEQSDWMTGQVMHVDGGMSSLRV